MPSKTRTKQRQGRANTKPPSHDLEPVEDDPEEDDPDPDPEKDEENPKPKTRAVSFAAAIRSLAGEGRNEIETDELREVIDSFPDEAGEIQIDVYRIREPGGPPSQRFYGRLEKSIPADQFDEDAIGARWGGGLFQVRLRRQRAGKRPAYIATGRYPTFRLAGDPRVPRDLRDDEEADDAPPPMHNDLFSSFLAAQQAAQDAAAQRQHEMMMMLMQQQPQQQQQAHDPLAVLDMSFRIAERLANNSSGDDPLNLATRGMDLLSTLASRDTNFQSPPNQPHPTPPQAMPEQPPIGPLPEAMARYARHLIPAMPALLQMAVIRLPAESAAKIATDYLRANQGDAGERFARDIAAGSWANVWRVMEHASHAAGVLEQAHVNKEWLRVLHSALQSQLAPAEQRTTNDDADAEARSQSGPTRTGHDDRR